MTRDPATAAERFLVQVIGFHWAADLVYDIPHGCQSYIIALIHEPVHMLTLDGVVWTEPHTFIIYGPQDAQVLGRDDRPWTHSWIRVVGAAVPRWLAENGLPTSTAIPFGDCGLSDLWLPRLNDEVLASEGADPVVVEHLFRAWLRKIRHVMRRGAEPAIPPGVIRARRRIEQDFLLPLRLAELAHVAGLSPSYFGQVFREHFGVPPLQYAVRLRMQHAAYLLEDGVLNVTEVARESGYDDVFYFSKLFKRHMGISPSRYANRRRE